MKYKTAPEQSGAAKDKRARFPMRSTVKVNKIRISSIERSGRTGGWLLLLLLFVLLTAISVQLTASFAYAAAGPSEPQSIFRPGVGAVTIKTVYGTISSATTTTAVAAVPGKAIVVWGFAVMAAGANNVTLNSDTTAINMTWPLPANGGASGLASINDGMPIYRTTAGEALTITTTTTQAVYYWFKYTEE